MAGMLIHGTAVALGDSGVLLRGASGSGKSDLALRLIDGGASLVADDQVVMTPGSAGTALSAPAALAGRLEVRGLGIMTLPAVTAVLALVVDLVSAGSIERLPGRDLETVCGAAVPRLRLAPFEASAPARLRLAAAALAARGSAGDT